MIRRVLAVMRREYLHRVRNRWFVISTIGVPLFMVIIFAVPIWMEARDASREREIGLIDETGVLAAPLVGRLEEYFAVTVVTPSPSARAALDSLVLAGGLSGYVVVDSATLSAGEASFVAEEAPGAVTSLRVRQAVMETVLEARLGEDADASRLLSGGALEVRTLGSTEKEQAVVAMIVGLAGAFLLYMTILVYGMQVMRSVLEEKTSRIVEVIVSAVRPGELMLGKIVGVGAVGLTQLLIWAVAATVPLTLGLPWILALRPELAELSRLREFLPGIGAFALFATLFVLGYFLFASLYAAVAAMCSTDEEAQQTQFPVTLLLIAPAILLPYIGEDPMGTVPTLLSLFPFFAPVLMFPRFLAGAPLWQVGLSILLLLLATPAVAWAAGRIYRVGILMQGKRPTLPEIWRWLRQA